MNDNKSRVAVLHGVAALAAIVLPWLLSSAFGWPTPVFVMLVVVLLGAVGASAVRSLGLRRGPDPQPPAWPTAATRIPPAYARVGPVMIASSDVAYRFRFTATVHWQQKAEDSAQGQNRRGADAQEALLDRAITAAQVIEPNDVATAGYRLAAVLAEPVVAPRAGVQVWASDVRVDLAEEDSERLAKLERIQKDMRLWEQERAHEKEARRYLGEDALATPGTALVWWLARHQDDIRGGVERIPDLTRISSTARDLYAEPMLDGDRNWNRVNSATATAGDEDGHEPPDAPAGAAAPVGAARALLHGIFPHDEADRARATRHLALLLERWGQRDLAQSLRGIDSAPNDPDMTSRAQGRSDWIHEPGPSNTPYLDDADSATDEEDEGDTRTSGGPGRSE